VRGESCGIFEPAFGISIKGSGVSNIPTAGALSGSLKKGQGKMSKLAIHRCGPESSTVIVEANGGVIADVETFSARHAELVSCDLALLAIRTHPEAAVVFRPPLNLANCQPAWGRTRDLLASGQRLP
jgi:hypothetical protein